MTFARRLSAATMALVLALFPVAMERCRTTCITGTALPVQAAPSAHPCHEAASDDDGGPQLTPMARACGHSDEARTDGSAGLAAAKTQTIVLLPAVQPLPQHAQAAGNSFRTDWSADRLRLSCPPLPLNSPLRL